MNQIDKDHEQWMAANAKWQYERLIEAKESGKAHYVDETGYVVIEKEHKSDRDKLLERCKQLRNMGSFAYNLSETALCADDKNLKILMDAFPHLLNPDYERLAEPWYCKAQVYINQECGK